MLVKLKNRLKDQRGLTLVELLAVIVILGIIAAIAVPAIGSIIKNSEADAVKADAIQVLNAAKLYSTQHENVDALNSGFAEGEDAGDVLKDAGYLEQTSLTNISIEDNDGILSITAIGTVRGEPVDINGTIEYINDSEFNDDEFTNPNADPDSEPDPDENNVQ